MLASALLIAGCTSAGDQSRDDVAQDQLNPAPQPHTGQRNFVPDANETAEAPDASPIAVARPTGPSCDPSGRQVAPEEELDWAEFIRFGGRHYYLRDTVSDMQLGEVVGRVRCRLVGSGTPSRYEARDGDAAYLDVGTALHRVSGRPLSDALGVKHGDQVELYEPE